MHRQQMVLNIAPDNQTATIHVRGRSMKRQWRREPAPLTKMSFLRDCRFDVPPELNALLRDLLNTGCAISLRYPRFRKVVFLELFPGAPPKALLKIWREHTGEDISVSPGYNDDRSTYVGMPWHPTR